LESKLKSLSKPVELVTPYHNILRISYQISTVCNYTCDYCFPGSRDGQYPFRKDWKQLADNFTAMFNYYKTHTNKNKFELSLAGGEPSMWAPLEKFCNEVKKENDVIIQLVSNASRTLRWWEENAHLIDKAALSCHHKEVDIDHFIQVADILYKKGTLTVVQVLMDPLAWDKCLDLIEKLKTSKYGWAIRLQRLEKTDYSVEQIEFLKKPLLRRPNLWSEWQQRKKSFNKEPIAIFPDGSKQRLSAHELSLNNWNNFYGWSCNLGIDSVFITPNGDITGTCNQKLFNLDYLYNIHDLDFKEKFNPTIQPTLCKSLSCWCVPEANLTKKKL